MADKSCIADGAKYATVFITVSKCLLWGALPDYKDALHLKKEDCKLCDKQAKHDDFTMMNVWTCIRLLQFKIFTVFVKISLSTFNINHGNLKVM